MADSSGAGSTPAIVATLKKTEIKMNKQMITIAIMASVGGAYRPSILDHSSAPIKKSKKPSGAAKARRAKKKRK